MNIDWGIAQNALAQPDPGQRFAMGMQLGRQQRQERVTREALGNYQKDPEGAVNQLMPENPGLAIQLQNSRAQQQRYAVDAQQDKQKKATEAAKLLAPLYQQLAKMPYEQRAPFLAQVRPRLAAHGIPDEIIAAYDPTDQNLQADIALSAKLGGATAAPNIQREVDYYRSIGRPELADQLLVRHAEGPPIAVRNPEDNTVELFPASMARSRAQPAAQAGPQPGAIDVDDETGESFRFKGGNPQDPSSWELVAQGGAGSDPRTFP